jgi:hypothetical protein
LSGIHGGLSEDPPESLRIFLREQVFGFEELRALLCLVAEPTRAWSALDVEAATGEPVELAEAALEELARRGRLVQALPGRPARYRYAASDRDVEALVRQLALAYEEQRLAVIRMMNENALHRVRSTAARQLAEAFRLDREKK